MKSRIALVVAALLVLVAAAGGAWFWRQQEAERDAAARAALSAFATAWAAKDVSAVPFADDAVRDTFPDVIEDLGEAPVVVTADDSARDGDTASADLAVSWTLPGGATWSYTVPTVVTQSGDDWVVATPAQGSPWHPDLPPGETFTLDRTTGERGDLVDRAGAASCRSRRCTRRHRPGERDARSQPPPSSPSSGRMPGSLTDALAKAVAAGSKAPIPVITYRDSDWEPRAEKIEALARE